MDVLFMCFLLMFGTPNIFYLFYYAPNEDISPVDDDIVAGSQAVEGVQDAVTGQLSISN